MRLSILPVGCAALVLAACARAPAPSSAATAPPATSPAAAASASGASAMPETDEHSYAEPDRVRIGDLALDLTIDFAQKRIAGTATYALEWRDPTATRLLLDTRALTIDKVEGAAADGAWAPLSFALAPEDRILGSKLTVQAPGRPARVRVTYATSPQASGLQWLEPAMTAGKRQPFMFSQSQQIHARSWVPLQDTPRVRFTYSARVKAPKAAMVLMSAAIEPGADNSAAARDGDYTFRMPQKIPSYLLAIAAGDLVFEPISARAGVWAEPSMAKKAAAEFSDTERMMTTTEALYGPYRWGRYDILVLPPSFPYGGMENPRMTFATPTAIVGDKSLVSLVAHELAHSWSGNLVTFSSAKDAWLNEGFTSYVENRIVESLYGKARADMEQVIARNELREEFKTVDPQLQALALKPDALPDPDGSSSATVYTKGAWFLQFLEQRFGRATFDAFLRGYFDRYAFQSIPTATFVAYAQANLLAKNPGKVTPAELEQWIYRPGVPDSAPATTSPRFEAVDAARAAWLAAGTLPDKVQTAQWSTQEWVQFLQGMPAALQAGQMAALDAAYRFTGTPNGEIAQRWYPLAVRSGYTQANAAMAAFLQRVGRRKLIMPTYEALVKTPQGLQLAQDVFAKARPGYHPITTASVAAAIAAAQAPGPADAVAAPPQP